MPESPKPKYKNLIISFGILLLSILCCLILLETISRKLFPLQMAFLKDIDHRLAPNGLDINEDGIRSPRSNYYQTDDLVIIFLGDSYTFGWDVAPGEAFPFQFERIVRERKPELNLKAVNFGWEGSSPLLSNRLLRDIGEKYKPDVVVYCLDLTDFHDDLMYSLYLGKPGIYRLTRIVPGIFFTFKWVMKSLSVMEPIYDLYQQVFKLPPELFFITNRPLAKTRPFTKELEKNLESIHSFCRDSLKAKFITVVLPRNYQYTDRESPLNWEAKEYRPLGPYVKEPFVYFDSLKTEVDYPLYTLLPDFEHADTFPLCFEDDPHWNPQGHRIAAWGILRICLQVGIIN